MASLPSAVATTVHSLMFLPAAYLIQLYIVTLIFNLHAEYIMGNSGLEEAQAGIKIDGRNISNLRYADATTLCQKAKRN